MCDSISRSLFKRVAGDDTATAHVVVARSAKSFVTVLHPFDGCDDVVVVVVSQYDRPAAGRRPAR